MILYCKVNSKYNINDIILFNYTEVKGYSTTIYGIIKAIDLVPVASDNIKIPDDTSINEPITFDELRNIADTYDCSQVTKIANSTKTALSKQEDMTIKKFLGYTNIPDATHTNTAIASDYLKDIASMHSRNQAISNTGTFQLKYKVYINTDNWTKLYGKYQPIYIQEKDIISKINIEEIDKLKNAAKVNEGSTPKQDEKANDTKIYSIGDNVLFKVSENDDKYIGRIVDRTYKSDNDAYEYKIQSLLCTVDENDKLKLVEKYTYYYVLENDIIKEW